ncbi:DNA polymerase III subunit gamma/tau [Patescibacteria group bacterium]
MSLALYRKYRPEKWGDVLGQSHVTDVLKNAVKEGNISHAYLFAGTRGTGKTTIARILAHEIGCSVNDLQEIDAASNRGIDDIRELREAVRVLPLESKYKVYIIDEVHMLTKEAFNALLKTLEEPPKHAIFMLATTEIQKLPDTIVSRCQTFTFKKPSHEILKKLALDTAKKEDFTIEKESADLIAMLGDGSFRDTLGIVQKTISASSDKEISREEVERVLGAPSTKLVNDLISAISEKDSEKALGAIHAATEYNVDMTIYTKLILRKLRAVLLLRFASQLTQALKSDFSDEDFAFLEGLAKNKDAHINSETLKEFLGAYTKIGDSYLSHLPLELAVIKLVD